MKNILNSDVRKRGKQDLKKVFKECRFKDGLALNEGGKPAPDDFVYYYNKSRDGEMGNYIIYEVISTDAIRRADDAVIGREVFAQIDVFSLKSFESKALQMTLTKLEEQLTVAGFEVEAREEAYEPDTRLYHQVFFVSKLYF
jgi:hypothetical protein